MGHSVPFSHEVMSSSLTGWRTNTLRNGILSLIVCVCATLIGTEVWQLSQVYL